MFSCPIFAVLLYMLSVSIIEPWLLGLFLAVALMHGLFAVVFYGRFAVYRTVKTTEESNSLPVSVIIAARNESENLYELLPRILEQNYPIFEVVVVNNQSTDESIWLLKAYQRQFPNLKVVQIEKSRHLRAGKKLPLTLAIKAAKYDHFVFTDADCMPRSKNWLHHMVAGFLSSKEIVLGYGPYRRGKGFLNRLIRFDTAFIALNYFSFALNKLPYMGVGRNLAYSRKVFDSVGGFKSHYHLVSGDDDLLIQQAAKNNNYCIEIAEESFCYSEPHTEWMRWKLQKTRHYSTSGKYHVIKKALLGIYPLSLWFMVFSFILLCLTNNVSWMVLGVLLSITILKWVMIGRGLRRLKENGLAWFFPLWDLFYAIMIPVLYLSVNRKVKSRW